MSKLTFDQINNDVLRATTRPSPVYFYSLFLLATGIALLLGLWMYQVKHGMGAANIHDPIDWGVYIANFVFWVGIAHSGTLISAILFLVRAKFRDAVSRSTEAMTIFAIMTAGLFPMIHLGRFWRIYYILPYPSQRGIWPNFQSPLVWDVLAVSTYFTVSTIFFYIGLIPDLAGFRDQCENSLGPKHWKTRLYRILASGWSGAGGQWRHYGRSYLFFAALATPLVISVHTVVSWDFAMSLLPGWHTTIFGPYFVAGAIHSGLAMALLLLIPMRRYLKLEHLIRIEHLEMIAKTILVTTAIMGYSYVVEPLIAWYSGNKFFIQFWIFQATGWPALIYWSLFFFNVFAPLSFVAKKVRRSIPALFTIGILVVIGMWLERVMIITSSTGHDYMPHNWSSYFPNLVEIGITVGSFCFFYFFFLVFSKLLAVIPISDYKGQLAEKEIEEVSIEEMPVPQEKTISKNLPAVTGIYKDAGTLIEAAKKVRAAGFKKIEFFSPIKMPKLHKLLGQENSPVRYWTLIGAIIGLIGGFALAIGTANVNDLIVGGKHPVSLIPYCIVGFEGLVLTGSVFNLIGFFVHSRFFLKSRVPYDRRYSIDTFALVVSSSPEGLGLLKKIMDQTNPKEIHFDERPES